MLHRAHFTLFCTCFGWCLVPDRVHSKRGRYDPSALDKIGCLHRSRTLLVAFEHLVWYVFQWATSCRGTALTANNWQLIVFLEGKLAADLPFVLCRSRVRESVEWSCSAGSQTQRRCYKKCWHLWCTWSAAQGKSATYRLLAICSYSIRTMVTADNCSLFIVYI